MAKGVFDDPRKKKKSGVSGLQADIKSGAFDNEKGSNAADYFSFDKKAAKKPSAVAPKAKYVYSGKGAVKGAKKLPKAGTKNKAVRSRTKY